MSFRGLMVLLLFLAIGSPASAGSAPEEYAGADGGWLVLSQSSANFGSSYILLNYREVGSPDGPEIRWVASGSGSTIDLSVPTVDALDRTEVEVLRLPPGRYELYYTRIQAPTGGGAGSVIGQEWPKLSIPFEVKPGRATYIGALSYVPLPGKGIFGVRILIGWKLVLTDESERDLAVARRKRPELGPADRGEDLDNLTGKPLAEAP